MSKPSIDAGPIAAAHSKLFAIHQYDGILAVGFGAHFLDVLQVDDGRTVDTEEHVRVEFLFQAGHGFAQQMSLVLRA